MFRSLCALRTSTDLPLPPKKEGDPILYAGSRRQPYCG